MVWPVLPFNSICKDFVGQNAMSETPNKLANLRVEIDRIDDEIAGLLGRRADIVAAVRDAKRLVDGQGLALRAAREADIIRRMARMTEGRFPLVPLFGMWRELLSAMTRMQSRLDPVLVDGEHVARIERMAVEHFGSPAEPLIEHSIDAALDLLRDGKRDVAILPAPDAADPWWQELLPVASRAPSPELSDDEPSDEQSSDDQAFVANASAEGLRVIGRLPFIVEADRPLPDCWVVAALPDERSSDDRAIIVLETCESLSTVDLLEELRRERMAPYYLGQVAVASADDRRLLHAIDVSGFVGDVTSRLQTMIDACQSDARAGQSHSSAGQSPDQSPDDSDESGGDAASVRSEQGRNFWRGKVTGVTSLGGYATQIVLPSGNVRRSGPAVR